MGTGAAIGAGTGLVAGSAVGSGNARAAGGSLQARYDTLYAQCMTAKGNRIAAPPFAEPVYNWTHTFVCVLTIKLPSAITIIVSTPIIDNKQRK